MDSPLALYRRYRPETFSEVIGQDHVTGPLRNALAADRVNHAYLFSGPRGCGKTTSARILARTLNCAQAPIAEPCGECASCIDLATGGSGSIDVIEIDAASHGGVDDARDLREKAYFAPVRDKYKIYIIDEAHMVTTQGFNALLKLVEEPPPHLRFIFATTEPEKVIPTIRSRTHHYPFRLIPPRMLSDYLVELCGREGVSIDPASVPLVVRAGGGSARDTLSVLDQLIGGSGPEGVTHQLTTSLLGFTPDSLLDEIVDAWAARDGASVFGVVDKVIESGQDPRRFTEDLLRRLRDLVIVSAVPDAPVTGLVDVSEDAGQRLSAQAARFGPHDLSRAADLVAAGLTEMRGATAPRLLLELICARVLLPGAGDQVDGLGARLDRMERNLAIGAPPAATSAAAPVAAPVAGPVAPAAQTRPAVPAPVAQAPAQAAPRQAQPAQFQPAQPQPAPERGQWPAVAEPGQAQAPAAQAPAAQPPQSPPQQAQPSALSGGGRQLSLSDVRQVWPDIIEATRAMRRLAWMHLSTNAQVIAVEGEVLTLGFANAGARESFLGSGCDEIVRQAGIDRIGVAWKVETILDPSAKPDAPSPPPAAHQQPAHQQPAHQQSARPPAAPASAAPAMPEPPAESAGPPPEWANPAAAPPQQPNPSPARPPNPPATSGPIDTAGRDAAMAAAREAVRETREPGAPLPKETDNSDDYADPDDPVADDDGLAGTELLQQTLGAQVIEEIPHD